MDDGFISRSTEEVAISLRVSPGARRTEVEGPYGKNTLKLRFAALPAGGKANAQLRRFFSKLLGVRKSGVEIVRGADSCGARRVLCGCLF